MTSERFLILSFVPFTGPWKTYRQFAAWVEQAEEVVREAVGPIDSVAPVPRHLGTMLSVSEVLQAQLASVNALHSGASGEQAQAVFHEHLPDKFLELVRG